MTSIVCNLGLASFCRRTGVPSNRRLGRLPFRPGWAEWEVAAPFSDIPASDVAKVNLNLALGDAGIDECAGNTHGDPALLCFLKPADCDIDNSYAHGGPLPSLSSSAGLAPIWEAPSPRVVSLANVVEDDRHPFWRDPGCYEQFGQPNGKLTLS